MNERRKKAVKQIIFGVILLAIAGVSYFFGGKNSVSVLSFSDCVAEGNPVMESYPRQCKTKDGQTFKEDIGNELEKDDLIRIAEPRPNTVVTSPLTISGVARGSWFFEASFPIVVVDFDGAIIGEGYATTNDAEWMTTKFVPFSGTVTFDVAKIQGGYSNRGALILKKANPSDLSEHDDALEIPVRFR
ncbi:MAG: Gmad2 immunoglobulin-like domain-containing protein [bacterium]|nr:Gmad2 immunoglobulin-like domain-containing protein [bacterium]